MNYICWNDAKEEKKIVSVHVDMAKKSWWVSLKRITICAHVHKLYRIIYFDYASSVYFSFYVHNATRLFLYHVGTCCTNSFTVHRVTLEDRPSGVCVCVCVFVTGGLRAQWETQRGQELTLWWHMALLHYFHINHVHVHTHTRTHTHTLAGTGPSLLYVVCVCVFFFFFTIFCQRSRTVIACVTHKITHECTHMVFNTGTCMLCMFITSYMF